MSKFFLKQIMEMMQLLIPDGAMEFAVDVQVEPL